MARAFTRMIRLLVPFMMAAVPYQVNSQTFSESALYNFCGSGACYNAVTSSLIQASDGDLYGTSEGGTSGNDYGTIFRITPSGQFTVIHSFCILGAAGCTDAGGPSTLIEGGDGSFYGTNEQGGLSGVGSIFRITRSGAYSILYSFCGTADCKAGVYPSGIIQGNDGNFYGTTLSAIFKITSTRQLTVLATLASDGGENPQGIIQGSDGNYYGTTSQGGTSDVCTYGCGTFFRMTPTGALSTLYSFCVQGSCLDGYFPTGTLVEDSNGDFYGVTDYAGEYDEGTAFVVTPAGTLTTLYAFCSQSQCTDGEFPNGGLTLGSDGKLYGTTPYGGDAYEDEGQIQQAGTIFQLTLNNAQSVSFSTIFNLCYDGNNEGCPGGNTPTTGVVQGNDGSFYGTTGFGGTENDGVVYKLAVTPELSAPVQVSLSSSQVMPGKPVTASLKVLNAFSLTMQQCYAFQNGTPLGKVPGTYNSSTKLYTFSGSLTPITAGIYNYAVTCGGVESGFATLTVGDTTQTTLTATPNPVTPPANDTLTATVTRTTSSGTPTGSVTFSVGTTVLGKSTLNGSGVATLSASSKGVAAGTYPVVATYSGDTNDVGSASAAVDITVE